MILYNMKWLKENVELVVGGFILIVIFSFLFLRGGNGEHLEVKMTTNNSDFSFSVGTGELEGKEGRKVLKVFYDDELLLEQTKEDLKQIVTKLEENKQIDVPVESKKQSWSKKATNLIFDVTHSYREGAINDADPQERFKKSLAFLEKGAKQYFAKTVKVWFLGAKEPETGKRRIINKDIYTLNLKPYRQGMILRIIMDDHSFVMQKKWKNSFHLEDLNIELMENLTTEEAICKQKQNLDDEFVFDCVGWPQSALAKIKELWIKYLSGEYNRGTFLLDYLHTNDFDKEADFVIFSDGEFQLQEDVHKKKLSKLNSDYRISNNGYVYNADNYSNDKWFPNYRESAIKYINYMTKFCHEGENTITFVGLSQTDNSPFIEFSKSYFSKLFEGCNVDVKQF